MAQLLDILLHVNFKRLKPKTSLVEVGWEAAEGRRQVVVCAEDQDQHLPPSL